jgi:hypothetical protein
MKTERKPALPMYYLGRPRAVYERAFPQRPRRAAR